MWMHLAAAAGIAVAVSAGVWKVYDAGYESGKAHCEARAAATEEIVAESRAAMVEAAASAIASIKVRHTTVRQEIEREIITNPSRFTDCGSGAAAVELFNSTLTDSRRSGLDGSARGGGGGVPGAQRAHE